VGTIKAPSIPSVLQWIADLERLEVEVKAKIRVGVSTDSEGQEWLRKTKNALNQLGFGLSRLSENDKSRFNKRFLDLRQSVVSERGRIQAKRQAAENQTEVRGNQSTAPPDQDQTRPTDTHGVTTVPPPGSQAKSRKADPNVRPALGLNERDLTHSPSEGRGAANNNPQHATSRDDDKTSSLKKWLEDAKQLQQDINMHNSGFPDDSAGDFKGRAGSLGLRKGRLRYNTLGDSHFCDRKMNDILQSLVDETKSTESTDRAQPSAAPDGYPGGPPVPGGGYATKPPDAAHHKPSNQKEGKLNDLTLADM